VRGERMPERIKGHSLADPRHVGGLLDRAVHGTGRARKYVAAGADWVFPEALQTRDEFAEFASAWDAPGGTQRR
jgi:2-methylisocitrate lyase-like PEP mutase family enzyme